MKNLLEKPKWLGEILTTGGLGAFVTITALASYTNVALASESSLVLEEVIVTATRRDESLQDVAVSVASIAAELDQATVRRLDDLQTYSPNLYIRRSPGIASGASITIRGIGTQDSDKSLDPAIGVMMDGVFLGCRTSTSNGLKCCEDRRGRCMEKIRLAV